MHRKYRVIAGPYRIARRFAQSQGWSEDAYVIVSRGHQLAKLDPALIGEIMVIKLDTLADRIRLDIIAEIQQLRSLWPVRVAAA